MNAVQMSTSFVFQQAKEGPCKTAKPGFFDFAGKLKWYVVVHKFQSRLRDGLSQSWHLQMI